MCTRCDTYVVKNGFTKGKKQRYKCAACTTSKVIDPIAKGFGNSLHEPIRTLVREGCGIRSLGRILKVSAATILRNILALAEKIVPEAIPAGGSYQVDELHTFVGRKRKEICVIYAWDKKAKRTVSLAVGTRSRANLKTVVAPLLAAGAKISTRTNIPATRE
jgi:insertion element IS1 protein InsB